MGSDKVMTAPPPYAVGDTSRAPVCLGNYIHEGESEAVSAGMGILYEALENPASNVRWEARAVVFDHPSLPSLHKADSSVPRIIAIGLFRSCATVP
jgi:hypothetical protein